MEKIQPHVIAVVETWLDDREDKQKYEIKGYKSISKNRIGREE